MHTTGKDCGGQTRACTPPVRGPHGTPESLDDPRDTPRAIALEDGTPLALRLASSGDAERLRRLFYRLSPATISRRLFLPAPQVPHWAEYFVTLAARDGALRQAVVALKGDEVVGFANFAREAAATREAETAIIVEDAWQRRGIGRQLMTELVDQARRRGVCTIIARILGDNDGALRFVTHCFPGARIDWEEGEYVVRLCLEEA